MSRIPSAPVSARGLSRRQLVQGAGALTLASLAASRGDFAFARQATPTAALPDFSGRTLNFMIIQPHAVTGDLLKADFEKATGATVNVTVVPYDQVQAKATLDVQSGANVIDVIDYWYPTVGALASQGIVEDLTDWIAQNPDIDPSDFIPNLYDVYTLYDGKRWGLPYDGDTHVLFYNKEILERNQVEPPTTWEEFLAATKKITEAESANGVYGAALCAYQAPIIIGSSYANRLGGYGGTFLDKDGKPALNTEAAVQAAQAMLDVAPYVLPTPLETAFDQALPAFLNGQIAMLDFWTDLGVRSEDPTSKVKGKWGVLKNPYGGANKTNVAALNAGFCFAVSSGSQNKDIALEFIKFATSKSYHIKLLTTLNSGIDPMRISGLESPEYKAFAPEVQAVAEAVMSGTLPWPTGVQSPDLMQTLSDQLALALQGQKDAKTAIADTQTAWEQILAG